MANRLAYVANSTMWPMWLIAEKSLLQLSGTLQTRFSQRNFNRATQVPSGSHCKDRTVRHYSHITSLLPSTISHIGWPMWLIAEKSHLQLSGSPELSKRPNAYWLLVQSEFDGCPGPVVATGCSVTL